MARGRVSPAPSSMASWRVNCVICVADADCQKSMTERLDAAAAEVLCATASIGKCPASARCRITSSRDCASISPEICFPA